MAWWRRGWARWGALASVLAVAAGVLVWLLWPGEEPVPRARQYRDYDVCLLTGGRGLADATSAAVWAGLQEVSTRTDVRVSYLAIAGPQTAERADQFLSTLVLQGCGVIAAAEELPAGAVNRVRAAAGNASDSNARMVVFDDLEGKSRDAVVAEVVAAVQPLIPAGS